MTRCAIYLRISTDRDGTQTATARQLAECQAYADAQGWEVVDIFEDEGISAWNRRKKRPEFERLVNALANGAVDVALAWKFDRLQRSLRDFARLKDAAEDGSIRLGGRVGRVYVMDLQGTETKTPSGRQMAGIMAAIAEAESENTSTRQRAAARERALQGQRKGGGSRAFGYEVGYRQVVPEEAKLVREAARRVIAGETLRGVAVDWRERGIRGTTGKVIAPGTIGRMLKSPTWSGQREIDGQLVKGEWRAVLKPAETERLRAILTDPSRLRRGPGGSYILTGLATCGRCGHRLNGSPRYDGARRYVCSGAPGRLNCGRLTRLADPIEELVLFRFFERLTHTDLTPEDTSDEDTSAIVEQLHDLEAAFADLAHEYHTEKAIPRSVYLKTRDELNAKIHHLRRPLTKRDSSSLLSPLTGATARGRKRVWDAKPLEWKRSVLAAVIDEVVIHPANRGSRVFQPDKVEVRWRI